MDRGEAERNAIQQRIESDPSNAGAYEALGDSLRRSGRLWEAAQAYRNALAAGTDSSVENTTAYKLAHVEQEIAAQGKSPASRAKPEIVFCPACGATNEPYRKMCENCGDTLPYDSFAEALKDPGVRRASLEAIVMVVIVLAIVHFLSFLPTDIQALVVMATIIVGGYRLLKAIDGARSG
jgi:tetratricopeptide (TPR) repeat protein